VQLLAASAVQIKRRRALYATLMRHIELHLIETDADIDLALLSGILTADQLDSTECAECGEEIGSSEYDGSFLQFAVVLDEDTQCAICVECASPVLGTDTFATEPYHLETFHEDDLEQF
jgi:hypothetical protein